MRPLFLAFCLLVLGNDVLSQKQNNIWCFGNRAGLNFNTAPPTPLESDIVAVEGCASISDPSGHLLFYTNGINIWDRNHNVMPNGTGLFGGSSSTQAALIVPLPKSNGIYYVFTTEDYLTDGGMNYSIVDMGLNVGFGDVEQNSKNILVVDKVGEKVTAILDSNGIDIWIITHKQDSNEFLSYLLTSSGLSGNPIISPVGSIYSSLDPIGPIRSSHSGAKVVGASTYNNIFEMFDFNNATGLLSNPVNLYQLFTDQQYVYGIEFSQNDSILYFTSGAITYNLFQLELSTNQLLKIATSTEDNYGAIQLGPDNQIYIANPYVQALGIIRQPNISGLNCQFQPRAIALKDETFSFIGLPNPAPYSFPLNKNEYSLGSDTTLCLGESLTLGINYPLFCDSIKYLWNTGSIESQLNVSNSGNYILNATSPCLNFKDTISVNFIPCQPIIYYDLNACRSVMADGSHLDYSEFVPSYPTIPACANITAKYLYRNPTPTNKHSCTPGINNTTGMCITSLESCQYDGGNNSSIVIEFSIFPSSDSIFQLSGLTFFEKGPLEYNWINGGAGLNNYPKLYGIRILKNNSVIYVQDSVPTSTTWSLQNYNFLNQNDFKISSKADFRLELLPYCPVGIATDVSAWDIDEILIFGGCKSKASLSSTIYGSIATRQNESISNVTIQLSLDKDFTFVKDTMSNEVGNFSFNHLEKSPYYLRCIKNDDVLNGVSTLDLIYLQRYLLGIDQFYSFENFIAADVNRNESINVLDLVDLRKVILGIIPTFPNNTSWRFGSLPIENAFYNFSQFNELKSIEYFDKDSIKSNFVGVKVGDLNGDAKLFNKYQLREVTHQSEINLLVEDKEIHPNEQLSIDFTAEKDFQFYGLQFALDLKGMEINSISSSIINIAKENISILNGILRVSLNSVNYYNIRSDEILFNIKLKSHGSGTLSNMFPAFTNEILNSEIYMANMQNYGLNVAFKKSNTVDKNENKLIIHPNLITQELSIQFYLPSDELVELRCYDLSGKCIFVSKNKYLEGFNTENISYDRITDTGLLFCQIILNDDIIVRKFIKI